MKFWCAIVVGTACMYSLVVEKEIASMHEEAWNTALHAPILSQATERQTAALLPTH